jgi:KTSC domain-containing protein
MTPEQIVGRMASAGDPQWEQLNSVEGTSGTTPKQVLEALGSMAGGVYTHSLPYDKMLNNGVFTAVAWNDAHDEEFLSNVDDFYNYQAGMFLDDEGFYHDRGLKYRFDPRGETGGQNVYIVAPSLDKTPAALTEVPTSSIFPARPRTVAAGYDSVRGVLTVLFRDATLYNYYQVDPREWGAFLSSRSKGRYIKKYLDGKIRGVADVGGIPREHRELMYRVARTTQVIQKGLTGRQSGRSKQVVSSETKMRAKRQYARQATKAYARATPSISLPTSRKK